jgi:hypothetical protein
MHVGRPQPCAACCAVQEDIVAMLREYSREQTSRKSGRWPNSTATASAARRRHGSIAPKASAAGPLPLAGAGRPRAMASPLLRCAVCRPSSEERRALGFQHPNPPCCLPMQAGTSKHTASPRVRVPRSSSGSGERSGPAQPSAAGLGAVCSPHRQTHSSHPDSPQLPAPPNRCHDADTVMCSATQALAHQYTCDDGDELQPAPQVRMAAPAAALASLPAGACPAARGACLTQPGRPLPAWLCRPAVCAPLRLQSVRAAEAGSGSDPVFTPGASRAALRRWMLDHDVPASASASPARAVAAPTPALPALPPRHPAGAASRAEVAAAAVRSVLPQGLRPIQVAYLGSPGSGERSAGEPTSGGVDPPRDSVDLDSLLDVFIQNQVRGPGLPAGCVCAGPGEGTWAWGRCPRPLPGWSRPAGEPGVERSAALLGMAGCRASARPLDTLGGTWGGGDLALATRDEHAAPYPLAAVAGVHAR